MSNCCDAMRETRSALAEQRPEFFATNLSDIGTITASMAAVAADASRVSETLLVSAAGDKLVSRSYMTAAGNGIVELRGGIGAIPVALTIELSFNEGRAAAILTILEPVQFTRTFNFNVGSTVSLDPSTQTSAALSAAASENAAFGFGTLLCIIRCGGASILGTLARCVPSLAGGPAAFVACVVGSLGVGDAANIAACVARECL